MQYVALLRGINVGGNRKVDMKALAAVFTRAGMRDVRTYINSGNVIFKATEPRRTLVPTLEDAIAAEFGFQVMVVLRSGSEWKRVADSLPAAWINGPDFKCDVMFLAESLVSASVRPQLEIKPDIDDVRVVDGAVLWCVPRATLTRSGMMTLPGSKVYAHMTVRNCNTVRKIGARLE